MPNLTELKAQLSILRQGWKLIPAVSPNEVYRRDCEENIVLIQIESESLRAAIKNEIACAKKVIVEKEDKKIVRTEFGWEKVRESAIAMINEREINGLAYYEKEIRKTYDHQTDPA